MAKNEKNEWTPLGEKYPPKKGYYIITYCTPRGKLHTAVRWFSGPIISDGRYFRGWFAEVDIRDIITAWMPMPKPYND